MEDTRRALIPVHLGRNSLFAPAQILLISCGQLRIGRGVVVMRKGLLTRLTIPALIRQATTDAAAGEALRSGSRAHRPRQNIRLRPTRRVYGDI
jgi:hypothetical protein